MTNSADKPKSLRDPIAIQSRLGGIFEPHISPLTNFVQAIRKETSLNEKIPYFDPLDGGINAKCLFLFEAPGLRAVKSGFISRNNPDESAKNFFELNELAGLPRKLTISWNIVPWFIGTGEIIRPAKKKDIEEGKKSLLRLLVLLPNLIMIVLCGRKAQTVEPWMKEYCHSLTVVKTWHPSPKCVNKYPNKKEEILQSLRSIKTQLVDKNI